MQIFKPHGLLRCSCRRCVRRHRCFCRRCCCCFLIRVFLKNSTNCWFWSNQIYNFQSQKYPVLHKHWNLWESVSCKRIDCRRNKKQIHLFCQIFEWTGSHGVQSQWGLLQSGLANLPLWLSSLRTLATTVATPFLLF